MPPDRPSHRALSRRLSARHRQGPAGRPFASPAPRSRASSVRGFGLSPANTERVAWLVEQHLTMSNMAQGRDLSDPRTAEALAAIVQTQERLKMLLDADMSPTSARSARASGTAGRASCCARSIGRPRSCSAAAIPRSTARRASQRRRRRCARALPGWSDPEFEAYAQRHYPAYWLKVEPRAAGRPRQAALCDGGRHALARDRSRDRQLFAA